MAKGSNLRSIGDLSPEEKRAITSAGGKAAAEAKKKKKLMKEQLETLLSLPVQGEKQKESLAAIGIKDDDMDNQMAILVAMFQEAACGNVKAFLAIRDTIGEMPVLKQEVDVNENKKLADVLGQLGGAGLGDDD